MKNGSSHIHVDLFLLFILCRSNCIWAIILCWRHFYNVGNNGGLNTAFILILGGLWFLLFNYDLSHGHITFDVVLIYGSVSVLLLFFWPLKYSWLVNSVQTLLKIGSHWIPANAWDQAASITLFIVTFLGTFVTQLTNVYHIAEETHRRGDSHNCGIDIFWRARNSTDSWEVQPDKQPPN